MKLTLNKTWDECLRMWKWVAAQVRKAEKQGKEWGVEGLKETWLEKEGYANRLIYNDCFFCEYAVLRREGGRYNNKSGGEIYGRGCINCPGRLIDPEFDCVLREFYDTEPIEFYEELCRLNKIRLSKK